VQGIPSKDRPPVSGKKKYTTGMMVAFMTAKTMYVLHEILLKAGPTSITTTKLKVQFDAAKKWALTRAPRIDIR
jgi:hypothetical protein